MPRPSASAVRPGAIAWVLAAQFFITQVVVASAWLRHFSLKTDYISDLGNTVCAVTFANSERAVCSPWHLAMNLSFMLLGVTMIIGAVLTRDAFPPGWVRELAVLLFSAAGVGVFIVGTYPINTNNARHVLGAGLNFVSGNIALIVFGLALSQRAARTGLRNFSVCAGALGLLATLLFVSGHFLGIGLGGMERVAAYPMTVWQIVVGIAFLRGDSTNPAASHRLAPTGVALLAVTLARVGFAQAAPASPRSRATVFTGHFLTLDTLTPRADAIAVGDGRILAVGTRADVRKVAGKGAPRVSLQGVTLPGFVDAHVHAAALGEVMEAVELRGLGKAALLERVRLAARTAPAGQWIHGSGWDQSFWTPAEFPTARELDAVSAGHPVVLERIDGHAIWVNDEVLTRASITRETPEGTGGSIVRDASGAPTGVFVDDAMALVHHAEPPLPMAARVRRLRAALAKYARWGSPKFTTPASNSLISPPTRQSARAAHCRCASMRWPPQPTARFAPCSPTGP